MYKEYFEKLENLKGEEVVKVELGAIDDFTKLFEKALDDKTDTKLIDSLRKAEVGFEKNIKDFTKAAKIGEDIKKQAKELGIDLPKEIFNKINSADAMVKEITGYISKIKAMYNIF